MNQPLDMSIVKKYLFIFSQLILNRDEVRYTRLIFHQYRQAKLMCQTRQPNRLSHIYFFIKHAYDAQNMILLAFNLLC